MSKIIKHAASGKDKTKRRRESESEDSDELMEVIGRVGSWSKAKRVRKKRKARKEEAEAVERKIEEHGARVTVAAGLKELAKKRNEYPIMLYMNSNALYIILCWFCFVHQTEASPPPPPAPAPAAVPSKADLVPTGTNPFAKLRGHVVMQPLNTYLVP